MKKTAAILASMALCTGFAADAGAEEAIVRLDKKGTLTLCAGDVNYERLQSEEGGVRGRCCAARGLRATLP